MNVLLIVGVGALLLFLASRTYPFWIARVFDQDDRAAPPAVRLADGRDYVATPTHVVFAHHFASIAGAGPILGPTLALAFGWGPAWLWIVLGGIFYGAVHDMSSMFVSVREGGRTIAEIARRTLGTGGYLLFVAFLLLVLSLVNAIFLKASAAALTSAYPLSLLGEGAEGFLKTFTDPDDGIVQGRIGGIATTSVIVMTLAAPLLGYLIIRRQIRAASAFMIAGAVCAAGVLLGFSHPVALDARTWMWVLAVYVFLACWAPVWLLLQPRDYMNVQLLYGGMALLLAGTIAAGLRGAQPVMAVESLGQTRQPLWPIMFITIACGAISGFHSLVATGTTVRQIPRESDCRRVGYNAMLLESLLALLVLTTVAGQIPHGEYMGIVYPESGAGNAILAFALGCGRLFSHLGIPLAVGCVLGILVIEGFLITTLDTAVRLGRYLFEELWSCLAAGRVPAPFRWSLFNTGCAVGMMLVFALSAKAFGALWPYFGSGNQLIGALALTTVTLWLIRRRKPFWFTAIPAAFMVVTAVAALLLTVHAEMGRSQAGEINAVVPAAGALLLGLAGGFVLVSAARIRGALREATRVEPAGVAPGGPGA
jgi:carbon starvation protein